MDTSVWIAADKDGRSAEAGALRRLLGRDEVATTGMVLAEVLQGARDETAYRKLAADLTALHYLEPDLGSWLRASRLAFDLRKQGQTTPLADLLIAAVALQYDLELYAVDAHFDRVPGLKRFAPDGAGHGQAF